MLAHDRKETSLYLFRSFNRLEQTLLEHTHKGSESEFQSLRKIRVFVPTLLTPPWCNETRITSSVSQLFYTTISTRPF